DDSLIAIGEQFGGRDHTTVMYAYDKITQERRSDQTLDAAIHEILSILER
ncbi:MAG: chromosomal replication initiator protein DnaA, partial [Caldisericales bacterium]|nr:chromosomal replication initiator protein DnaA [Caldisericales bacterium]